MKQLVIIPGGFHPFHAGHAALYQSAQAAFPAADVYVAATNDTSTRPFPFAIKEKLAKLAGVEAGHFIQVKSPFRAEEIVHQFDPNDTQLIFVRSEKDANKPPQGGGTKKDGSPSYLQPLGDNTQPLSQHAYMAYLPTVEFGPGMTSATEIRTAWPTLNEKRKTALVMSLYPKTQTNPKLAVNVVKMLDTAMGVVDESALGNLPRPNKRNQFKSLHRLRKQRGLDEQGVAENTATGINRMFNNLGDPVYSNLQRVALLAMQGRQSEAAGRLQSVIKDASTDIQKKITDAVNNIKPVTINGKIADSSTLDKSKQHNDWIINTFIPWVQSLLGKQGVAEGSLGTALPWPNVVNKVSGAMKAMGWKGTRKADGTFMFSTRGQETDDQYYIVIIDNAGEGFFTYALGTIEEGDPRIGEQESLPNTEASVSELMNAIRDGFGLSEQGVAEEKCPHCNGPMVSEELMNEKKDACYYKVKSRYKVWPSAYASGALVKCRKKGADSWGNGSKNESSILEGIEQADESLHDWFNKEKWVRMDTKGNIKGPCAKEPGEGKPKCLPQAKAHSLGKKGRASAAARKRREDPNPDRSGKAINVNTKKD